MKALLPVAGNGTRMYPLGVTTPKCLITVLNKPLMVWTLEGLAAAGVDEVVLVVSAGVFGQRIRQFAESIKMNGLKISIAVQEQQLGTAHVVQVARDFFSPGEEFIFVYGDDLYGPENLKLVASARGSVVLGQQVTDPEKWGIFQADESGTLISVVEKPQKFVGDLANIGCMRLPYRIFELYDQLKVSERGEIELTDSLQLLAQETTVQVMATKDYWIPIGYPWHILEATEHFLPLITDSREGTIEEDVHIEGKVRLPATSRIKAGTRIEGNVVVGEHTTIGPNAFLRGAVCVGDHTRIGFCTEVKNSVIGNQTRISHQSYVADSLIGNEVNLAVGTLCANWRHDDSEIKTPIKGKLTGTGRNKFGAVIGDGVHTGIGTKIYPGRKIWPGKTTKPGEIVEKDILD
jgi:UDP-N-acetylglucosamine diphosphorylase/glucosamine-1-phosphate N-acetyltransferase